jgi:Zn ribbon nucleic-acid-binding protein
MTNYPADTAVRVSAKCPDCGTLNQLTMSRTLGRQAVTCSHCGAALGLVSELVARAKPEGEQRA